MPGAVWRTLRGRAAADLAALGTQVGACATRGDPRMAPDVPRRAAEQGADLLLIGDATPVRSRRRAGKREVAEGAGLDADEQPVDLECGAQDGDGGTLGCGAAGPWAVRRGS